MNTLRRDLRGIFKNSEQTLKIENKMSEIKTYTRWN